MFKNSARAAAFKNFFFKVRKYISEEWRQEKDPNSIFRALVWWLFLMTLLASLQTLNYSFDFCLYCTTKLCINRLEIVKHWTHRSKRMSPFFIHIILLLRQRVCVRVLLNNKVTSNKPHLKTTQRLRSRVYGWEKEQKMTTFCHQSKKSRSHT